MPATANKIYRNFVKGLITEASPLTYPENCSIDEDNCILYRKGNRTRRMGMDYEDGYQLSSYSVLTSSLDEVAMHEFVWEAVENVSDLSFFVHRVGFNVYFYNMSTDIVSDGLASFSLDLRPFVVPGQSRADKSPVEMASGKGRLFIVGQKFEPIIVTYDVDADDITAEQINILIRDFEGIDDGLANDDEPASLTDAHHYNLRNQGWITPNSGLSSSTSTNAVQGSLQELFFDRFGQAQKTAKKSSDPIESFYAQLGRYPGNNKQWWVAKKADGDNIGAFDAKLLNKQYFGNTRAPRGHYVVNAFRIDRSAVSGVPNLELDITNERPSAVGFFSGRAWYGVNSNVYFSQVMDDRRKAGFCYQDNDPTAEDISDLLATDGGVIPIPEAIKICKLVPLGDGLFVFAQNGLWYVSGTSAGFSATDFMVSKVSPIGTDSPDSIVVADTQLYWWSRIGILAISPKSTNAIGPASMGFDRQNITENTIQTLYNDIPERCRARVKGVFDASTNTVQWLFSDDEDLQDYFYNRILILDLTLGAFYPWTISSASGRPYLCGLFTTTRLNQTTSQVNIVSDGIEVEANGVQVVTDEALTQYRASFIKYICAVPQGAYHKFTFSYIRDRTFADWKTFEGSTGYAYTSFMETGYELLEDTMRKKAAEYVFCYFRRTEENYVADGDDYTVDWPSSCYFQIKWDWADSRGSNKWSTKVQAYRLTRVPMFSEDNLEFDTGFPIVVTKHKVRGNGRAIQFRFENSELGKDFDLLGWAVAYSGNPRP